MKRTMDIVLAVLMVIVFLPVLVAAALLIKIDSKGPILFRQVRMGRHFRRFQMLKLRTMRANVPGYSYTLGNDPRITRVGRWLRWLKLDEFPQLWNVVRGEMSLVGPRPVVPELVAEFHAEYAGLLRVRPGLTDPATEEYCREAERLAKAADPMLHFKTIVMPDKLRISADYIARATWHSDVGVMLRTALALLPKWTELRTLTIAADH